MAGVNSDSLKKSELAITLGISIGSDDLRLEGEYFYLPKAEKRKWSEGWIGREILIF